MHWLCTFASALALGTLSCGLEQSALEESSQSGDLCERACQRRVETGCAAALEPCADTCQIARAEGYCTEELDANLECVAETDDLRCGRAPNGGACDEQGVALEHCVATHTVGDAPLD